jgi:endonuclease G
VPAAETAWAQGDPNDPDICADLWEEIGLPSVAEDVDVAVDTVCHEGYITAHNAATKTPDWVIEHLTREIVEGDEKRPKVSFKTEPSLPDGTPRAGNTDYTNSGYDRGHQAPSDDFGSSRELMVDTFFYSNAVPQVGPGFNQLQWRDFEALVNKLAINRGELFVITGPVYQKDEAVNISADFDACGTETSVEPIEDQTIGSEVAVPGALFKIIYDPRLGRVNAYVMPNIDHRPLQDEPELIDYLKRYKVGVNTVRALTGYRFFDAFSSRKRNRLESKCGPMMLH